MAALDLTILFDLSVCVPSTCKCGCPRLRQQSTNYMSQSFQGGTVPPRLSSTFAMSVPTALFPPFLRSCANPAIIARRQQVNSPAVCPAVVDLFIIFYVACTYPRC
jgi:hypothetical protein